jgi:hypothetical protein
LTERQKDRKTERQKDRKTERQKDRKTERQKDRKTERQKGRKTDKKTDRKTERQKNLSHALPLHNQESKYPFLTKKNPNFSDFSFLSLNLFIVLLVFNNKNILFL